MHKLNSKLMLAAVLAGALLAGCGGDVGGNGDLGGGANQPASTDPSQSVAAVFAFISQLIANNDENSDPIDINALTLAVDETSESATVN